MQRFLDPKKLIPALLILLGVMFFYISYTSEGTFDAGDGIRHYLVSRYSWPHPAQLLYSWGKPFFTLISSPFSQFGLIGINVFNILCGLLSAFFCYKIAITLKMKNAWLVIPFLLFTPCYFPTMNSGLTEPFFSFIFIFAVYLFIRGNLIWSLIVISFLAFVRTEGNLILLMFGLLLVYRRKFKLIPLLGFGTIVYSIIGSFYYKDIFWVKNQNPYTGMNSDLYGHGELLHFVMSHNFIWGTTLGILFVLGGLFLLLRFLPAKKSQFLEGTESTYLPEEFLLIYGSFAIYFVAHSIFWWKGIVGSLGLLRVIAAVAPASAFICLRGFNLLTDSLFNKFTWAKFILIPVVLFLVIRSPFKHDYFPYGLDPEQKLVKDVGDWYKASPFTKHTVWYLYPFFAHVADVDPFNEKKVGELWGLYPCIKEWGIQAIPDSTLVIWDGHFGPNECRIPLQKIMNDEYFDLVQTFKPEVPFTVLGGYSFEIYAFMKRKTSKIGELIKADTFDLEAVDPLIFENVGTISTEKALSGKTSCKLSNENEYSLAYTKKVSEIEFAKDITQLGFTVSVLGDSVNYKDAVLVLSVDGADGKNIFWDGKPIDPTSKKDAAGWQTMTVKYMVSADVLKPDSRIKLYVWNKGKGLFYADNIVISFFGHKGS